jgi:hypothetical protein
MDCSASLGIGVEVASTPVPGFLKLSVKDANCCALTGSHSISSAPPPGGERIDGFAKNKRAETLRRSEPSLETQKSVVET